MTTYLTVDDGLKRALGFLPDDDLLDDSAKARMEASLKAAENYVQAAIGEDNQQFYQSEKIKDLYTLAVNAIAANWYNHPSSAVSSTTAKQIIGQLRGSYDELEVSEDGSASECGSTEHSDSTGNSGTESQNTQE